MANPKTKLSIDRRQVGLAILFILALYVLLPQISGFKDSWRLLGHIAPAWTLFAVCLALSTYIFAALTYYLLSFQRIRYLEALLVQFAATLMNRLLPAGVGGLGANYAYLRHRRHNLAQAASVVAMNNLLGLIGHILIILVVLALTSDYSRNLAISSGHSATTPIRLIIGLSIVGVLAAIIFGRKRLKRTFMNVLKQIVAYRQRPWRLSVALLSSMSLTLCSVLTLYSCINALGVHLPVLVVILIFTFGLGAGTATPTPGGLGGFEAGLVAGFVAYHVDSSSALAIALLFRFITYWLTLLLGIFAFVISQRRHLFET